MIEFPQVARVESGDPVTSRQLATLADGINARIISGLGDGAWRIVYLWLSAARQFRISGNADAEFFHGPQMLDGELALPSVGNVGGIYPASPVPLYVYGSGSFPGEREAIAQPEDGGVPMAVASDAESIWQLAKQQRGTVDLDEGQWSAPAFDAARHVFRIVYGATSIHGNAYGGFQPTPAYLGDCTDGTSETPPTPNYEIKFTNTQTLAEQVFDGTCPDEPTHIAGIWSTPIAYWVSLNNGTLYYFDRGTWIEGPYTGGNVLKKSHAEHLPRILNSFCGEFRGDAARVAKEDAGKARWLGKAFDIASFLSRPYYLSPAKGELIGEEITATYPSGQQVGTSVSGDIGFNQADTGFWFVAAIIRCSGARVDFTVRIYGDDQLVATRTMRASSDAQIVTFESGYSTVRIEALQARGQGSGNVSVSYELAEVYQYRPGIHDLWTLLRLSAASSTADIDGSGRSTANASDIYEAYIDGGVIPKLTEDNALPEDPEANPISRNAVFDKFRRQSRVIRCIHRNQLRGYAVENGKSIVWVSHNYQSVEGLPTADTLSGIRDAIASEAEPGGYTNEWVGFWRFNAYHPSATSDWSVHGYADYWSTSDRCMFYAPTTTSRELKNHFNANYPDARNYFLAPEAATGYRYSKGANSGASEEYYRSCRIYEPPLEIESAETVVVDGEEQTKIIFNGRFHHHHSLAPESIDRDVSSWDLVDLLAETQSYRTDENAIRDYLAHVEDGSRHCEYTGPGNAESGSTVQLLPDNPFGACWPTLWLVQLLPKPYADGNDSGGSQDTPIRHDVMTQAETYIRAICEGYVDGRTSVDYGCETGVDAVFDYTFPNLCFDAFGGTSITTMPTEQTARIAPDDVREDSPIGYGPLPTVVLSAEQWNQYADAVNTLTRVRVTLPWELQVQSYDETNSTRFVDGIRADGSAADCSAGGNGWLSQFPGSGRSPTTMSSAWAPAVNFTASHTLGYSLSAGYVCSASGAGPLFQVENIVHEDEYKFEYTDPNAVYAVPKTWRDMISTHGETLWTRTYSEQRWRHTVVPLASADLCSGLVGWDTLDGINGWDIEAYGPTEQTCEILPATGRTTITPIGTAVLYGALKAGNPCTTQIIITETFDPVVSDAIILRVPLAESEEQT